MAGAGSPAAVDPPLRVRLLGGFHVEGFDEHDLGTRKARVLLKRLAASVGEPVSVDELVEVVWADSPPRNPADQISVLVSRLRAVLGADRLPRTDAGYRLAADWFDLAELDDRVAEIGSQLSAGDQAASLASAHAVLSLAAGTLLPEETDGWTDALRPAADRLVARGRLLAAEAARLAGELDAARAAAQAVLDSDPYDEAALRLAMRADAQAGRPAVALAAYAELRQRLADDLGTDPAPETDELHLAVMRGEVPAARVPFASAAELVGRGRELAQLDQVVAEQLLDQAIALNDSVEARLSRCRIRLARLDVDAAREDADQALLLGAGVLGFELAGWVAYYTRDYDTALRYAEEGVARSTDDEVRASCLALAGRIRHTRGDLAAATLHLNAAVDIAPAGIRPVVQVWRGQLLAHLGEPAAAIDSAKRALLDPYLEHPFAAGHGWFTVSYALAVSGQWNAAMDAVGEFDAHLARRHDKRLPPTAANVRGWLLRGAGQLDAAIELHQAAAAVALGPTFLEAHYAAMLDHAECLLAAGHIDAGAAMLDDTSGIVEWVGSMSWRHRNRYRLLCARVRSLGGSHDAASHEAHEIASTAAERGDRRYHYRALVVAATVDARAGVQTDPAQLRELVTDFEPLAGPDGWRDLGELAATTGSLDIWQRAEAQAAELVKQAQEREESTTVAAAVRRQLDALKP